MPSVPCITLLTSKLMTSHQFVAGSGVGFAAVVLVEFVVRACRQTGPNQVLTYPSFLANLG